MRLLNIPIIVSVFHGTWCAAQRTAGTLQPSTNLPSPSQVTEARNTAPTLSPTSSVPGKAFDKIIQIWLSNANNDVADSNEVMNSIVAQGITLTNFWAVSHPSQPNYIAAVGGDTFGLDHDELVRIPGNISTVVDLLDTKGISWAEYLEDMPYAGYQGSEYTLTSDPAYVRRHNPLIHYDSITRNETRLSLIKNFTSWERDRFTDRLPQWSFVTPNMTNNGQDENTEGAASWARGFLRSLTLFEDNPSNTLIVLTFDHNGNISSPNKVFTVLLGSAIPKHLRGQTDRTFYTHYSALATVEENWDLPTLGRWDCRANVFEFVADQTNYMNSASGPAGFSSNESYPGPLNNATYLAKWPAPYTGGGCGGGRRILESIADTWRSTMSDMEYTLYYPTYRQPSATTPMPTSRSGPIVGAENAGVGIEIGLGWKLAAVLQVIFIIIL